MRNSAKLLLSDYQEAREELVQSFSSIERVDGIYEAGSVTVCGLSDLDFVVFVSDSWKLSDTKRYKKIISKFSNMLSSLIGDGNILLVNSASAGNIKIIDDFNLRELYYNREFAFVEFNEKEYEILRVMDWLPERLSKIAAVSARGYVLDHFRLHGVLKSLLVSLTKVESLIVSDNFSAELETQKNVLNTLRQNFVARAGAGRYAQDMRRVSVNLFKLACDAVNLFAEYLHCSNQFVLVEKTPSSNKFYPFDMESKRMVSIFGVKFVVSIPSVYFLCLYLQAHQRNELSHKLQGDLEVSFDLNNCTWFVSEKIMHAIRNRSNYTNQQMLFLKKNNLTRGLLKYGFYLNE